MSEQRGSPGVRTSQTWMAPESALAKRGSGFFHAAHIGSDFSLSPPTLSRQTPLIARTITARSPTLPPSRGEAASSKRLFSSARDEKSLISFFSRFAPPVDRSQVAAGDGQHSGMDHPVCGTKATRNLSPARKRGAPSFVRGSPATRSLVVGKRGCPRVVLGQ